MYFKWNFMVILHHINASSHKAIVVQELLAKNVMDAFNQAPYSPDKAQCDFSWFPKLKITTSWNAFWISWIHKENSLRELKAIPQSTYKICMKGWVKHTIVVLYSMGPTLKATKSIILCVYVCVCAYMASVAWEKAYFQ